MDKNTAVLNQGSYAFPRLDDKNKDLKYHKQFAQSIVYRSIDDNYATSHAILRECYKFAEEGSSGDLTQHLQVDETGNTLPVPWLTLNTLRTKLRLLLGELEERGYEIKVRAQNKEAISRKLEEKEKLRVRRRLQPLVEALEAETGMPLENSEDYIPINEAELNEYFDLAFKDKAELIIEAALKYLAKRNHWDEERVTMFRDVLIANRVFVRNEIVRGVPRSRRIDPLCFIHDPDCKTDTLEDATYFGEVEYLPLASAAERYNLSEEEIKEVYGAYQTYLNIGTGGAKGGPNLPQDVYYDFGCIGGQRVKWFKEIEGQLRVLVVRAVWRDYKDYKYKKDTDKYGTEHLQEITEKVRKREESKIKTKKFEVWRQCTLVGGLVTREWGECPNQARDLSDLEVTEPPYKAWIPNFAIGRGVSIAEQLAHIQLMKDIAMYNMNLILTTSTGGKVLIYDMAMMPEGWRPEDVMKYMRVHKVAFVNSKESQLMPGNMNLFKEVDMALSESIRQYMEIMRFYDLEMDKISGVSQERQGIAPPPSQSATATQAVLMGSNLVTAPLFKGFERFCSRVLNHQAKLIKIVFPKSPETFAPIIGTSGVNFLQEHVDLDLDEFNVWVESLPPNFMDRQRIEQVFQMAVQADPDLIDDYAQFTLEQDTKSALRKFQRSRKLRKIFQAQQQMAMEERDAQMQQRLAQLEAQTADKQINAGLQETEMKNQGSLERTLAQGRTRLSEKKIQALSDQLKTQNK